jgi:hypothetical protein
LVHDKERNCLGAEKTDKLSYIHANMCVIERPQTLPKMTPSNRWNLKDNEEEPTGMGYY